MGISLPKDIPKARFYSSAKAVGRLFAILGVGGVLVYVIVVFWASDKNLVLSSSFFRFLEGRRQARFRRGGSTRSSERWAA